MGPGREAPAGGLQLGRLNAGLGDDALEHGTETVVLALERVDLQLVGLDDHAVGVERCQNLVTVSLRRIVGQIPPESSSAVVR